MTQATSWQFDHDDRAGAVPTAPPAAGRALSAVAATAGPALPYHEVDRLDDRQVGFLRTILIGSTIGFVIVATAVFLIGLSAGWEAVDALGMAAFAGLWGGPGFGGMMGATIAAGRHD